MNLIYMITNYYNYLIFDGLTLVILNLFIYVFNIFNLFGLFFLFNVKYIKTLNELKNYGGLIFLTISIIILLLSLAGIPPLFGFIGKFLLFIFFMKSSN